MTPPAVPYRGPARLGKQGRRKHIIIGVLLFLALGAIAVALAWLRSVPDHG